MKLLLNNIKGALTLFASAIVILLPGFPVYAGPSLGLQTDIISDQTMSGSFPLLAGKQSAPIYLDSSDWPGVLRAGADLQADVERVTGIKPVLATNGAPTGKLAVIIGTLGKSPLIDGLVKSGKINGDAISGKWESFIITTVANPLPGVDQALVIAGSDKRGTIYGIYEISEQIGVSPWYWWADVPAKHHENLFIKAGTYVQGPPVVKYRGIFINDEAPAFCRLGAGEIWRRQLARCIRTCSSCCCGSAPTISGRPCGTTPSTRTTRSTPARRRIRHRHGHFAPRADDPRPEGMDKSHNQLRQRLVELSPRTRTV